MRIKKIEWKNEFGGIIFNPKLPFGYRAETLPLLSQICSWAIYKEQRFIDGGVVPTLNEAQTACEKAWEEIVKEALEPSDLYVISTEEGIDSICTSADGAKLRQQEVMACSGCMEGFVIVEEFVVDLDGNVTEVEYEE